MNPLERLERRAGGVQPCIRLLGVSQNRYYNWRRGDAPLPPYIAASIRAHLRASDRQIREWIEK